MPLKNDDERDPELHKLKTERNLYMQYNLAAIKAHGTSNLPHEWKVVSPLNRFKTKLKFNKLKINAAKAEQEKEEENRKSAKRRRSNESSPTGPLNDKKSSLVPQMTAADKMMFKSLISSQEFSLGTLNEGQEGTS